MQIVNAEKKARAEKQGQAYVPKERKTPNCQLLNPAQNPFFSSCCFLRAGKKQYAYM
jgi:hypothetical protein